MTPEELNDMLNYLQEQRIRAAVEMDKLHRTEVRVLMRLKDAGLPPTMVAHLYAAVRKVDEALDEVNEKLDSFSSEMKITVVPMAFGDGDSRSVTMADGGRVGLTTRTAASIRAGRKEPAYAWLRAEGHGDIISETVNASTLGSLARDLMKDLKELPEEDFNVLVRQEATYTRGKAKGA